MPELPYRLTRFVQRSIFLKLFLIYATTTLALALAVAGYTRFIRNDEVFKQTRSRMAAHHFASLISEIGNPPERERAVRLSQELGIEIRVEGP